MVTNIDYNTSLVTLHHGAHTAFAPHVEQCWTEDEAPAASYAGTTGEVMSVGMS